MRRFGGDDSRGDRKGNDYCYVNATIADQIPPPDEAIVSLPLICSA
jgi:hypothetical protein